MYGGDDVGAVVLDFGTSLSKVGFAGENVPRSIFPTAIGVKPGERDSANQADAMDTTVEGNTQKKGEHYIDQKLLYPRPHMELESPVIDGLVEDWNAIEKLWRYGVSAALSLNMTEHPALFVESVFNTEDRRAELCKLAFETLNLPAVFICNSAVLSSFSQGRQTSLIVDAGASGSSVTVVREGYALKKSAIRTKAGGNELDRLIIDKLATEEYPFLPRYRFKRHVGPEGKLTVDKVNIENMTKSYEKFCVSHIVEDLKKYIMRVSDVPFDEEATKNIATLPYELPDGHYIQVGVERFTIPEEMFRPKHLPARIENEFGNYQYQGLPSMIHQVIAQSDIDIQRDLYNTMIAVGGCATIRGFPERLFSDVMTTASPAFKVKTMVNANSDERRFAPWIGGSILASLGTFQQMWVSKGEYEEEGASLIAKKCP